MDRGTEWMIVHSVSFFCRIKSGIVLSDKPKEVKRTQRRFALPVTGEMRGDHRVGEADEADLARGTTGLAFHSMVGVFVGQKM